MPMNDNCISYANSSIYQKKFFGTRYHEMLDWFKNNLLEANPIKFQNMLLKNKKAIAEDFDIIVNDTSLNITDEMKKIKNDCTIKERKYELRYDSIVDRSKI